ncbi:MAG: hypothetical protein ACLFP2_04330 [Candidatus Woesearchaeota archaeon]
MFDSKLAFYCDIRAEEKVQNLGAEHKIRDLVETMDFYVYEANKASFLKYRSHYSPLECDFEDMQSIAYLVGTFWHEKNFLQRIFTDPFAPEIERYSSFYEQVKAGDITSEAPADQLLAKSKEYGTRMGKLYDLADAGAIIREFYMEESLDMLERINNNDLSGIFSLWKNEKLSSRQISQVSHNFRKQADINGIISMINYLVYLQKENFPDPVQEVERAYKTY